MKEYSYTGLLRHLESKQDIRSEQVQSVWDHVADMIVEQQEPSQQKGYNQVMEKINGFLFYDQIADYSPKQAFLRGGIWGSMSIVPTLKRKEKVSHANLQKLSKYRMYEKNPDNKTYQVLKTINKNPGVQNKQLADEFNVSKARISQIIKELNKDGLIMSQTFGKEKAYYLKRIGQEIIEKLENEKTQLPSPFQSMDYKFFFFSNQQEDISSAIKWLNHFQERTDYQIDMLGFWVGFHKKQTIYSNSTLINLQEEKLLCEQKTSNSYQDYRIFLENAREADSTKQLVSIG